MKKRPDGLTTIHKGSDGCLWVLSKGFEFHPTRNSAFKEGDLVSVSNLKGNTEAMVKNNHFQETWKVPDASTESPKETFFERNLRRGIMGID